MKENTYPPLLLRQIVKPVSKFVGGKMTGGILLLAAAIFAFAWANSPYSASYYNIWNTPIVFGVGNFMLSDTLGHWINDGLMVVFFFVIGLEIKREVLVGELSSMQKAALPAVAALGGMIVPAVIYFLINRNGIAAHGWGIPMATDIAFSLGCLLALGSLIPLSLKVFLLALAIVDDMGAILVIALYYTEDINMISLAAGITILVISLILNIIGVRKTYPYALLGIAIWLAFLLSGIHATIAGVLLAFTIPARIRYDKDHFKNEAKNIIREFPQKDFNIMLVDETQRKMMKQLKNTVDNINTPLQKLEDNLYPVVSHFIIPLFALANAGVSVGQGGEGTGLMNPVSMGIIAGLFLGKQLGITFFSWISVKLGWALLPEKVNWSQIWGISCLAGIGFTMSLFITNLAFVDPLSIYQAKIGVMLGSLLSAILGISLFLLAPKITGR